MFDESNRVKGKHISIQEFLAAVIILIFIPISATTTFFAHSTGDYDFLSLKHYDFEKILMFCGIGIYLTVLVLLYLLLKRTLFNKTPLLFNLFIVLALSYSALYLTSYLSDVWAKKFTVEKWNTYSDIRKYSMNDLYSKHDIKGMSKEQILDLLGSNRLYIENKDGYEVYSYRIGQFLISTDYLRIYMKDNIVVHFDQYAD